MRDLDLDLDLAVAGLVTSLAEIAEPLSKIYQLSYETGSLPDDWKKAHVVPIFKKGDRTNRENYHPVSLTSVPCKIMESIIKESLVKHLEANKLLCEEQHGFRRVRSCLTNLLETLESWTQALDDGYGLDVIFLDYRKAAIGKTQGIRYQGKSECMYRRLLGLEQQQSGSEEHFRIGRKL